MSYTVWQKESLIQEEVHSDRVLLKIIEIETKPDAKPGFTYQQDVLFYEGRLVLSAQSKIIPVVRRISHHTLGKTFRFLPYLQAFGSQRLLDRYEAIQKYVKSCDICQRKKYLATSLGIYCNCYLFLQLFGKKYRWILLRGYQSQEDMKLYQWWWSDSKYCHFIPLKRP